MATPSPFPRRPPRLTLFQSIRPFYFVTFNTAKRNPVLAVASVHDAFTKYAIRGYTEFDIAVGRYVLMPDHLHLFVCLPETGPRLTAWIAGLKRALGGTLEKSGVPRPFWQEGFFDHVLRSAERYSEKWDYVRNNPVRRGLCSTTDEWPWQGEIVPIRF